MMTWYDAERLAEMRLRELASERESRHRLHLARAPRRPWKDLRLRFRIEFSVERVCPPEARAVPTGSVSHPREESHARA
jgi:hypothetical protein